MNAKTNAVSLKNAGKITHGMNVGSAGMMPVLSNVIDVWILNALKRLNNAGTNVTNATDVWRRRL